MRSQQSKLPEERTSIEPGALGGGGNASYQLDMVLCILQATPATPKGHQHVNQEEMGLRAFTLWLFTLSQPLWKHIAIHTVSTSALRERGVAAISVPHGRVQSWLRTGLDLLPRSSLHLGPRLAVGKRTGLDCHEFDEEPTETAVDSSGLD
jgi:hypothetical protein